MHLVQRLDVLLHLLNLLGFLLLVFFCELLVFLFYLDRFLQNSKIGIVVRARLLILIQRYIQITIDIQGTVLTVDFSL